MSWRLSHKLTRFNPIPANARWVECDDHGFPLATADYRELGHLLDRVVMDTLPPSLPVRASGAAIAIEPRIQATIKVDSFPDSIFPLAGEGPCFLLDREIDADDFGDEGLSLSTADIEYTVTYYITGWGHTHRCTCKRWATNAPGPLAYCPKCSSMGSWVPFTEPPPKIPEGWLALHRCSREGRS